MNRFGPMGPGQVVAPFAYQPTRQGLRGGFGRLGTSYSPPVGAGAGAGAETGAEQGAAIGTNFGPIGTAIGAVAGAIGGAIAGSINKKDPEQYNFDQAVAIWSANRNAVFGIGNKYLVLAGLFDLNLKNPHIPIYLKYGHMGEQKFVTDMVNVIYQAAINGQITAADTPQTVMSRIVQPWIDSWGYGPMVDPHADLINLILLGMVAEYLSGQEGLWLARSGVAPNWSLPPFPIQHVVGQQQPAPSTNIVPVGSPAPATPAYSPDGSVITVQTPGTIKAPAANFSVSGTTYAVNGSATATSPGTAGLAYVGGQVYRYDSNGATYVWNGGWQATNQAPAPAPVIAAGINAAGSGATAPTPAQLVANPPAIGASVAYAPDMSQAGAAMGLPAGLVFAGTDPYNGSWILRATANGQLYVLWGGTVQPYTTGMFGPAASNLPAASTTSTAQSVSAPPPPVVTGSGTTGVSTGMSTPQGIAAGQPTATAQPVSTAQAGIGWAVGLGIVGTLFLASKQKKGRRRAR
jgi:hypothetical protein